MTEILETKPAKNFKIPSLLIFTIVILSFVAYSFSPSRDIQPESNQIKSYEQAKKTIKAIQTKEKNIVNPVCQSELLEPDKISSKVVVLLHGFTNCPAQFHQLGLQLQAMGYTVYIPRLPRHGLANRLTDDLKNLTDDELVTFANESYSIARGLGTNVTVVGLSAGGVLTAWLAENKAQLNKAIIISPSMHHPKMPEWAAMPSVHIGSVIGSRYIWWDEAAKDTDLSLPYAYPGYPLKGMIAVVTVAQNVLSHAIDRAPGANVIFISNAEDTAVNRPMIHNLEDTWSQSGTTVTKFEFPKGMVKSHDIIDPNQREQNTAEVYPILLEFIKK